MKLRDGFLITAAAAGLGIGGLVAAQAPPPGTGAAVRERPAVPQGAALPPPVEPPAAVARGRGIAAEQYQCGALFRESFETPYLHPRRWRGFQADPGVTYAIKNGIVRVFGTEGEEQNSNRLVSADVHSDDAVLVCGMRANTLTPGQGKTMYRIHYCGRVPDRYAEVALENYAGDLRWRFWCLPLGDRPEGPKPVVATIPAGGVDLTRFHELMVERDGPTSSYRGYVHHAGEWRPIGQPVRTVGPFMKVELKWWVDPGCPVDVEFTRCRVYPNPKRHPLRFFVANPWGIGQDTRLEVWTGDGKTLVGRAPLDGVGVARIPLDRAPWNAYPASAVLKLFRGRTEIGSATVEADGLSGLYPNDLWKLSFLAESGGNC
jgi:hypothetical protein